MSQITRVDLTKITRNHLTRVGFLGFLASCPFVREAERNLLVYGGELEPLKNHVYDIFEIAVVLNEQLTQTSSPRQWLKRRKPNLDHSQERLKLEKLQHLLDISIEAFKRQKFDDLKSLYGQVAKVSSC